MGKETDLLEAEVGGGGASYFCRSVRGPLDSFVKDKEEFSLEIPIPHPIKVRGPFLWICKRWA